MLHRRAYLRCTSSPPCHVPLCYHAPFSRSAVVDESKNKECARKAHPSPLQSRTDSSPARRQHLAPHSLPSTPPFIAHLRQTRCATPPTPPRPKYRHILKTAHAILETPILRLQRHKAAAEAQAAAHTRATVMQNQVSRRPSSPVACNFLGAALPASLHLLKHGEGR